MDPVKPLRCIDGFRFSVQAGMYVRCTPKDNVGPWTHVEVGFPSEREPLLDPYFYDGEVYNFVPIEVVCRIIIKHDGLLPITKGIDDIIEGELDEENPLIGLFQKRISLSDK